MSDYININLNSYEEHIKEFWAFNERFNNWLFHNKHDNFTQNIIDIYSQLALEKGNLDEDVENKLEDYNTAYEKKIKFELSGKQKALEDMSLQLENIFREIDKQNKSTPEESYDIQTGAEKYGQDKIKEE